jgi:hypothetical protein
MVTAKASWFLEDNEVPESVDYDRVEVRLTYEDDTLWIDGLREDGAGFALELRDIGRAIADGAQHYPLGE